MIPNMRISRAKLAADSFTPLINPGCVDLVLWTATWTLGWDDDTRQSVQYVAALTAEPEEVARALKRLILQHVDEGLADRIFKTVKEVPGN